MSRYTIVAILGFRSERVELLGNGDTSLTMVWKICIAGIDTVMLRGLVVPRPRILDALKKYKKGSRSR
jgi:hypothetical protein